MTCHENPPHELAAIPAIGLELQVPSSEAGDDGAAEGVGEVFVTLSPLGASVVDVCSKPAQALVVTAAATRAAKRVCFIVAPRGRRRRIAIRHGMNVSLQIRQRACESRDPPSRNSPESGGTVCYLESGCRSPAR